MISDKAAVIEVLTKAQAMVSAGWCQNTSVDGNRVCSLTAIARAADSPNFPQLRLDAEGAFRSANKAVGGITYWNDRPERTWPQAIEGFTKAIEFARAA